MESYLLYVDTEQTHQTHASQTRSRVNVNSIIQREGKSAGLYEANNVIPHVPLPHAARVA